MHIDSDGFWYPWKTHANDNEPKIELVESKRNPDGTFTIVDFYKAMTHQLFKEVSDE